MLMAIPDEVYDYMDLRGEKPVIIATAPESIKQKAREINDTSIRRTGKPFFAEIKDKPAQQ